MFGNYRTLLEFSRNRYGTYRILIGIRRRLLITGFSLPIFCFYRAVIQNVAGAIQDGRLELGKRMGR